MQIARVALDVPLHRFFDYLVPEGELLVAADIGLRARARSASSSTCRRTAIFRWPSSSR